MFGYKNLVRINFIRRLEHDIIFKIVDIFLLKLLKLLNVIKYIGLFNINSI